MPPRKKSTNGNGNGANLGFEATLWSAADKMRNNMNAAEYKHVVLGLIFLKYISHAFDDRHARLLARLPNDHAVISSTPGSGRRRAGPGLSFVGDPTSAAADLRR